MRHVIQARLASLSDARRRSRRSRAGRGPAQRDRALPSSFRLPVVLCYFEGLTLDEAARRLRCPAGTVRSRMARAREKLRRGLTRRGVVLPAAALAAALARPLGLGVALTPTCAKLTARAAIQFAAGQSAVPLAAALALEVLRSMCFHKLKFLVARVAVARRRRHGAAF